MKSAPKTRLAKSHLLIQGNMHFLDAIARYAKPRAHDGDEVCRHVLHQEKQDLQDFPLYALCALRPCNSETERQVVVQGMPQVLDGG